MTTVDITTAYHQVLAADSDIQAHLSRFVALVEQLDAKAVCELGVRTGTSTIAWLEGLRRTEGHLWACDLDPAPFTHPRMTFLRGDDCDEAILARIPDDLDIVLVDSSHHYRQTVREIELYTPKVAEGGCIVFHDVAVERFDHHPDDEIPFPVRTAVEEAAFEREWKVDWFDDDFGLAVCWP